MVGWLVQCQPVEEAGTPWAEIVAGTHFQDRAYQTALSEAQTRRPMDDLSSQPGISQQGIIS